jgi:signal transduction histidine kinase/CheY-like chemotaxis protein
METSKLAAATNAPETSTGINQNEPELVFELDSAAQCLWINDRVKQIFGDVRGKHLEEIFSNQPEVINRYQEIQNGHEFIYFEVPDEHNWEIRSIRSGGALSGAVITALPANNLAKRYLPPSTWSYDLITNRLTLARPLAEVFGFSQTVVDFETAKQMRPKETGLLISGCRRLLLGSAEFFLEELEILDAHNDHRWLSIRGQVAIRTDKGQVIGINGSIEEITARVHENQERQSLEHKMMRVQKMEAIGELAGGIAHDFNNILTSVMGYTELALMEAPQESSAKLLTYLQEIYGGGRRARELVAKMLTFSRADESEPSNLDLMQEVKEIVKMLRATLPSLIEIRIDIDEGLPEIFIDKQFLQQVVMNICINARDAMPSGGAIHIRGRQRTVRRESCSSCHTEFVGEFVELSIEDTGQGIPEQFIERLFEPYVSSKQDGSGMGLAMVHGIMHRQGGHIKVDSLINDGTEVRLFLKPADAASTSLPEQPHTKITPTENTGSHVLVVDDEVSLAYFIRELLQRKGFEVSVATDSHEAWDLFSANPEQYDLVVTDQTMPGLSGVQLAGKMITLRPDLPVMLCTGYSDVVDETNIAQYGIQAFMPKPLDSKEFLRTIDEMLSNLAAKA